MINRLRNKSEVFWFFFSKKNLLPCFHSSVVLIANWYEGLEQVEQAASQQVEQAASQTEFTHHSRDLTDRQNRIGMNRRDGGVRHRGGEGFLGVLNEHDAAVLLDRQQTGGAVPIAAAQNDADHPIAMGFGG